MRLVGAHGLGTWHLVHGTLSRGMGEWLVDEVGIGVLVVVVVVSDGLWDDKAGS